MHTASVVKLITKRKDFPVPETCDAVRLVAEGAAKEAGGVEWGRVSAEESLLPVRILCAKARCPNWHPEPSSCA